MLSRVVLFLHTFGLKRQFLLLIVAIYLVTGAAALGLFLLVMGSITQTLGEEFATQYALRQRDRILAPIQRELALSLKMADSPLLKRWARDEHNPELKASALAELESYRRHFFDHAYFIALDASKNYYFSDAIHTDPNWQPLYVLDPTKSEDRWYFATLPRPENFDLNVDWDRAIKVTKLWINTVIRDGTEPLGIGGAAIALDRFIAEILGGDPKGVTTVLIDRAGAIKAHRNPALIDHDTVTKSEAERQTFFQLLESPADRTQLKNRLEMLATGHLPVALLPITVEGHRYLASVTYLHEIDWFTVVLVNLADLHTFWRFVPFAVLLGLSLLVLATAVMIFLNRLVLNPLAQLHQSAQAMSQGDYQQHAMVTVNNEMGDLTRAFNQMAQTVYHYTGHLEQLVDERTQALRQSNEQLADTHQQLVDSIEYAQLIQQSLLPQPALLARTLGEYFIIWRPRNRVGGDFYYSREDAQGGLFLIADCTGHGVPGALMTMAVSAVLHYITDELRIVNPAQLLQALNQRLRDALHHEAGEGGENGLDAGVCWRPIGEQKLLFAGARLDLYYHDRDSPLMRIRGDADDIGYRRSNPHAVFTNHTLELPPGRSCYLTTDGLFDQAGGAKGYGFGRRRFQHSLQDCCEQPLVIQCERLEQALADWQGDLPQRDDITVIGFRPV